MSEGLAGDDRPRWVAVGRIARPHGVKGEVSLLPLSQVPERFQEGSRLFLDESEERPLTVRASRPHRQRLLVSFQEITDRTVAEELTGRYVFVPVTAAPPLPEDQYWTHELVGCEVVAENGRRIGSIREVIHTHANDVWVAEGEKRAETLIPALKDVVIRVELGARRIVIRDVPGLTSA